MASWWVTEAVPIPITALLPLIVLPAFSVMSFRDAAAPFSNPTIMLLMGGFIIATAVERWNLHARIALNIVYKAGERPAALVGGFMLASALLSMWISNTATTIMLAPIAVSVGRAIVGPENKGAPLTVAILLGLAYGASIGGIATPVGTPTNLIVMAYLNEQFDIQISFAQWIKIGLPVALVMLPAAWLCLTRFAQKIEVDSARAGSDVLKREIARLGAMSVAEKRVLFTFAFIAACWVFRSPLNALEIFGVAIFAGVTDHLIAIFGAVILFLIPAGITRERLLDWPTAVKIPWGVLLLFGGGLSMASAISKTGLAAWLGVQMAGVASLPLLLMLVVLVAFVIFATELASNVATASALLPLIGALAVASGQDPILMSIPIAMAASCAFMLPIATGPNAIAFATGEVSIAKMARIGLLLNLLGVVLISTVLYLGAGFLLPGA